MTSHQFADQLLLGPDLPIMIPKVVEYCDSEDCCADPVVSEKTGLNENDQEVRVLILSYKP